jgi:signal peptidase I
LFIDSESTVGGYLKSIGSVQVFVFNATIGRGAYIADSTEVVQICGTTFTRGDVNVFRSGQDILVGSSNPIVDCAGNTLSNGDLELRHNTTDVEFVASGNTVSDDMEVFNNKGPVEKTITDNTGGDELECYGNEDPIAATGNTGWDEREGQCRVVLTCEGDALNEDVDEVVVPANATCFMLNANVSENVTVHEGAYFQALATDIGGKVRANDALTLFIDLESTVGGDVKAHNTAQVFVYGATIGKGLQIHKTTEVVQICGNTFTRGDVKVTESGIDILVGLPVADCAANTVSNGDVELRNNTAEVEFVVSGNTISDDLEVFNNKGPVEKTITDNTGGDELECFGNEPPVLATGNTFARVEGQCVEV